MHSDRFINNQSIKRLAGRLAKEALLAFAFAVLTLGALLTLAATNEKDLRFDGKFNIKLVQKKAQGAVELVACSRVKDAKILADKKAGASNAGPPEVFARTTVTGRITRVN